MRITGSITALATPFHAAGQIDAAAWKRLLDQQLTAGTQALVVAGSTGEAAALDDAEFEALLRQTVEHVAGRVPVIAGTGMQSTAKTVAQTRRAQSCGADAALVVTPPYVRPTQTGLLVHYTQVAEQGGLPVILYNVPTRTGSDLLPETVAQLRVHPRIVGIKEARPEESRMQALIGLRGADFSIFSGDDPTAGRAMLAGADGVVSVASNVVPAAFRRLCELARAGDSVGVARLNERLRSLLAFLAIEPNPIPLKALLAQAGIGHGLRLPLMPLSAAHAREAIAMAKDCIAIENDAADTAVKPTLAA
ncbi:MAG: 4-hydroxy-tetrahydrodipicolinate synthase [Proteobacteria bacterium]|nr:4-hydroxy-tetrahydrodipicolinate synthase [Pseudomonadota bacterium]